jgi:hypothetical protein
MPGLIGAAGGELPGATGATGSPGAPGGPGVSGATGAAGANGAAGATGTIGPTGPSEGSGTIGPTGPTGPGLAATLETEKSETGVWIVTTPHEELPVPYLATSNISFPVPLAKRLTAPPTGCAQTPGKTECHVKLLGAAETKEIAVGTKAMPGCKAVASPVGEPTEKETEKDRRLLEEPVAETSPATALESASGNLCVYTGVEEKTSVLEREAILNAQGNPGASPTGGTVAYIDEVAGLPGVGVKAQGSWAVKAGP